MQLDNGSGTTSMHRHTGLYVWWQKPSRKRHTQFATDISPQEESEAYQKQKVTFILSS